MSPLRRPLVLALALSVACSPTIDGEKADTADSGEPGWVGDAPGGDDTGEAAPCGETGICPLEVVSASAECGGGNPDRPQLDAEVASDGTITARVFGAAEGCSPQVEASGSASVNTDRIDVGFTFYDDFDDCVCPLDATISLRGAPAGEYTLLVNGLDAWVTVP